MSDNPPPPPRREWRTNDEWNRLLERIEGADLPAARSSRYAPWKIAAAAALLVGAVGIGWKALTSRDAEWRMASTAAGERIVIRLADSSIVTLGPASSVRYAIGARRREVELEGLADFKVVHDATRPFVVRAGNAVTTDLGTEFVVRAYRGDSSVQVAVTAGLVSLASASGADAIELRPGNVGHVAARGAPVLAARQDASARAAWVDRRLVFDDEPLESIAAELGRWFDVDIRVADTALARRRVSAVYNDPSLSGVLDALDATLGVRIVRAGRTITFSERAR